MQLMTRAVIAQRPIERTKAIVPPSLGQSLPRDDSHIGGVRADAQVVHVDPERPQFCGIALEKPEKIWDLFLPPDDWNDNIHVT